MKQVRQQNKIQEIFWKSSDEENKLLKKTKTLVNHRSKQRAIKADKH